MTLKNLLKLLAASSLVALGFASAPAHAVLTIDPATGTAINQTSNCNAACLQSLIGGGITFSELYKDNQGGSEEGALLGSYMTTYGAGNLTATISYTGGDAMTCGTCYLLVKDGNNAPNQIYFNLTTLGWNGTESIFISNPLIWPNGGSISHISLFGKSSEVCTRPGGCFPQIPEPGTLALFGLGLLGLVAARRRSR